MLTDIFHSASIPKGTQDSLKYLVEPTLRETFVVVFDEWDWNDPKVHEILVHLTGEIKQVTVGMGFKLP